jgi:type II secretory pathway pseudopilin PulG
MRRRSGFTLVELLVAAALIIFMMAVLAQAFQAATQAFRDLKAAGDLAEKLRAVAGQLRADLAADHFEGKKRLSDPTFWSDGPPRQGFFRVYHSSPPVAAGQPGLCLLEGADLDGLRSYRSADHMLHLTVKQRGNDPGRFFAAKVPADSPLLTGVFGPPEARFQEGGAYRYQWAEVAYFLRPSVNDLGLQDTANGTPLYTLYRRHRAAVLESALVPDVPASRITEYLEVSCGIDPANPSRLAFYNPADLTAPARRFGMTPEGLPAAAVPGYGRCYPTLAEQTGDADLRGSDVALTDVVSFDVRLLLASGPGGYAGPADSINPFVDLYDPSLASFDNGNPVLFGPAGPRAFDTWSAAASTVPALDYSAWDAPGTAKSIPMWNAKARARAGKGPVVRAVQITLRVWDIKTSITRQVTVAQGM